MSDQPAAVQRDERRPLALLFVYSWDMLRALLAVVSCFAAFAGGVEVGGSQVALSTFAQVMSALSSAAYAATLIVTGVVLTRHQRWVARVQIWSLFAAIVLVFGSVAAERLGDPAALLGAAILVLIDAAAVVAMTGPAVRRWYTVDAPTPRYVIGLLGFWAAISVAFLLFAATVAWR